METDKTGFPNETLSSYLILYPLPMNSLNNWKLEVAEYHNMHTQWNNNIFYL